MTTDMTCHLGFDIGGTKTEAVVLGSDGALAWRKRAPSPDAYPAMLDLIAALTREARTAVPHKKMTVGCGIPGKLSRATGKVVNANSSTLNGHDFARDITARLGCPVAIENDANCFALSEAADGAGKGAASVFGVILGTGVGGGIVIRGALHGGASGIAGEWGHNPLSGARPGEPEPACPCGGAGHVEAWLAGPALARQYQARAGARITAREIIARMRTGGDPDATACFDRYVENLARALGAIINVLDPEVIVLGGGMSNVTELYERVPLAWGAHIFSDTISARLLPNVHGDASGVRGAAWAGAALR